jgi:hypothetical protein
MASWVHKQCSLKGFITGIEFRCDESYNMMNSLFGDTVSHIRLIIRCWIAGRQIACCATKGMTPYSLSRKVLRHYLWACDTVSWRGVCLQMHVCRFASSEFSALSGGRWGLVNLGHRRKKPDAVKGCCNECSNDSCSVHSARNQVSISSKHGWHHPAVSLVWLAGWTVTQV